METTLKQKLADEDFAIMDRRIINHLVMWACRKPGRFIAPTVSQMRYAAWSNNDELIRERLERLVAIGRIAPATRMVNGQQVYGFVVLPRRLWELERRRPEERARLTTGDAEFLRACGIAWE
jgi:hypothetical protein